MPIDAYRAAILILALAMTCACSRQPDLVADPSVSVSEDSASTTLDPDDAPAPLADSSTDLSPHPAGFSAAAGLPVPLQQPLATDVEIDFEYGTLLDFAEVGLQDERQATIEPIEIGIAEAMASLDRSLRSAGFIQAESEQRLDSITRHYQKDSGQELTELVLLAQPYPDPESAAHPGGTGTVAIRSWSRQTSR